MAYEALFFHDPPLGITFMYQSFTVYELYSHYPLPIFFRASTIPTLIIPMRNHVTPANRTCSSKLFTMSRTILPPMCSLRPPADSSPPLNPTTDAEITAIAKGAPKSSGLAFLLSMADALDASFSSSSRVLGGGLDLSMLELVDELDDGDGRMKIGVQYSSLCLWLVELCPPTLAVAPSLHLAAASRSLSVLGGAVLLAVTVRLRLVSVWADASVGDCRYCWYSWYHQFVIDLMPWRAEILDSLWKSDSWVAEVHFDQACTKENFDVMLCRTRKSSAKLNCQPTRPRSMNIWKFMFPKSMNKTKYSKSSRKLRGWCMMSLHLQVLQCRKLPWLFNY